ncbi:site-specific integrase [Candidatus Parcubacteria bacterium]|nr:MAG: site-specific integrase [Candidatus Parcubacteria bacterium]
MQTTSKDVSLRLQDLLESFLYAKLHSPETVKSYEQAVRIWVSDTDILNVEDITVDAVLKWRKNVVERSSAQTFNKYRRHLRAIFSWAIKQGLVHKNPFSEVEAAPVLHRRKKSVATDLLKEALDYLESNDCTLEPCWLWATIIRTFFYTGMRRRQLVSLNWRDVDLKNSTWTIRAEYSKTRRELVLPIAPALKPHIFRLKDETERKIGGIPDRNMQVFCAPLFNPRLKQGRLTEEQISDFFRRISEKLSEPISAHKIRHTVATLLASSNNIRVVQDLLGHVSIHTTMQYIHPDISELRRLLTTLPTL